MLSFEFTYVVVFCNPHIWVNTIKLKTQKICNFIAHIKFCLISRFGIKYKLITNRAFIAAQSGSNYLKMNSRIALLLLLLLFPQIIACNLVVYHQLPILAGIKITVTRTCTVAVNLRTQQAKVSTR